jgi:hypothetical protein
MKKLSLSAMRFKSAQRMSGLNASKRSTHPTEHPLSEVKNNNFLDESSCILYPFKSERLDVSGIMVKSKKGGGT